MEGIESVSKFPANDIPGLDFRPESHEYFLNSQRLPGVTEILKANGLIDERWFTEESRSRGSAVHRSIELLVKHDLRPENTTLHQDLYGYVRSFQKIISVIRPRIIKSEYRMASSRLGFAGTCDLIWEDDRGVWIIDIKTGLAMPWTRYQVAGYGLLNAEINKYVPKMAAISLHKDGSMAFWTDYSGPQYYNDGRKFLALQDAYKIKMETTK